ncbi:MAG: acyltransferase [Clostridium sp.]|nr:acyltransferase [Clostridium sp.]
MKQRCEEIDLYKAILCILVVFGHSLTQSMRENLIISDIFYILYSFHMPVFFTLSGIIYNKYGKKYTIREFLRRKAVKLLVPYVSVTILFFFIINIAYFILNKFLNYNIEFFNFKSIFIGIFFGKNDFAKHLWFLYALFIIEIITKILDKYINKNLVITLFISFIFSFVSYRYTESNLLLIARVLYYNFYFQLGNIVFKNIFSKRKYKKYKTKNIIIISIIFLLNNIVLLTFRKINMINEYNKWFFSLISSVSMFLIILVIINYIINLSSITLLLKKIYQYSFEIYLFHNPFITIGSVSIMSRLLNIDYFAILFGVLMGLIIPIIISKNIIKRNKLINLVLTGEYRLKE